MLKYIGLWHFKVIIQIYKVSECDIGSRPSNTDEEIKFNDPENLMTSSNDIAEYLINSNVTLCAFSMQPTAI